MLATLKKRLLVQKTNANDHAVDDHAASWTSNKQICSIEPVATGLMIDLRGAVLAAEKVERQRDREGERAWNG